MKKTTYESLCQRCQRKANHSNGVITRMKSPVSKRTALGIVGLVLASFLFGAAFVYAQVPTNTLIISAGAYPGAYAYTIWTDGTGLLYAKNHFGALAYSGSMTSTFQEVLDNGGAILILPGTYILDPLILQPRTKLVGSGIEKTFLRFDLVGAENAFATNSSNLENPYIELSDFSIIDTNTVTTGSALRCGNLTRSTIQRINIWQFGEGKGIYFESCYFNSVRDVQIDYCKIGIDLNGTALENSNVNEFANIRIQAIGVTNSYGFKIESAMGSGNNLVDSDLSGLTYGIYVEDDANSFRGIWMEVVTTGVTVVGAYNTFYHVTFATAVTTKFSITGANNKIDYCYGYVTDNWGQVTPATDTGWYPHGLSVLPSYITITPLANCTAYLLNFNTTHFQVGLSVSPTNIRWHAHYDP